MSDRRVQWEALLEISREIEKGSGLARIPLSSPLKTRIMMRKIMHREGFGKTEDGNMIGLDLCNFALSALPASIGLLTELKVLYLDDNQLRSLPDSIGQLRNLRGLYLSGNNLESLPESFRHLGSLRELDLRNNNLHSLPDGIGLLNELRELHIGGNKLSSLPESMGSLPQLMMLDLSGNPELGEAGTYYEGNALRSFLTSIRK